MNTLFPVMTPPRCDELIRAARLRRVAREAAKADWYSTQLNILAVGRARLELLTNFGSGSQPLSGAAKDRQAGTVGLVEQLSNAKNKE